MDGKNAGGGERKRGRKRSKMKIEVKKKDGVIVISRRVAGEFRAHKKRIEQLKKLYTRYFPKQFENQINSILDSSGFVYYDEKLGCGRNIELLEEVEKNMKAELGYGNSESFKELAINMENMQNYNFDSYSNDELCQFFGSYLRAHGIEDISDGDILQNIQAIKQQYLDERDIICKYIALNAEFSHGNTYNVASGVFRKRMIRELLKVNQPCFQN